MYVCMLCVYVMCVCMCICAHEHNTHEDQMRLVGSSGTGGTGDHEY